MVKLLFHLSISCGKPPADPAIKSLQAWRRKCHCPKANSLTRTSEYSELICKERRNLWSDPESLVMRGNCTVSPPREAWFLHSGCCKHTFSVYQTMSRRPRGDGDLRPWPQELTVNCGKGWGLGQVAPSTLGAVGVLGGWWSRLLTHCRWSRIALQRRAGLSRAGLPGEGRGKAHPGSAMAKVKARWEQAELCACKLRPGQMSGIWERVKPSNWLKIKTKEMLSSGLDLHKIMKFFSTHTTPAPFSSLCSSPLTSSVPVTSS